MKLHVTLLNTKHAGGGAVDCRSIMVRACAPAPAATAARGSHSARSRTHCLTRVPLQRALGSTSVATGLAVRALHISCLSKFGKDGFYKPLEVVEL